MADRARTHNTAENHISDFPVSTTLSVLAFSFVLNVAGGVLARELNGLLFLDTIGTAVCALALGPWWGATIGALTNLAISNFPCKQQFQLYCRERCAWLLLGLPRPSRTCSVL